VAERGGRRGWGEEDRGKKKQKKKKRKKKKKTVVVKGKTVDMVDMDLGWWARAKLVAHCSKH
jgi:hypothetical protein